MQINPVSNGDLTAKLITVRKSVSYGTFLQSALFAKHVFLLGLQSSIDVKQRSARSITDGWSLLLCKWLVTHQMTWCSLVLCLCPQFKLFITITIWTVIVRVVHLDTVHLIIEMYWLTCYCTCNCTWIDMIGILFV